MMSSHPHGDEQGTTAPTVEVRAVIGFSMDPHKGKPTSCAWYGDSGTWIPFREGADTISYQFIHPPLPMEPYRDDDNRWVAANYDAEKHCHKWMARGWLGSGKDAVRCHIGAVSLKVLRSVGVLSYSTKSACQRAIIGNRIKKGKR